MSTSDDLVLVRASDVAPEPVVWLWDGRIAIGTTTMIAGNPGLGKSQLMAYLAATVTTGRRMVDGSVPPDGDVLYLTAEDSFGSTVVPRLLAAGADLRRVHFVDAVAADAGQERGFDLVRDCRALDALLYRRTDVRLVIIDPVTAYLGATDSHRTSDVRGVLRPLERVAQAHHVAVVLVSHLNKGGGAEAITRVTGSLAFVAAARSAYLVTRDPQDENRRLLLTVKQNLAIEAEGLAFTVESELVEGQQGASVPTSRIVFLPGTVMMTADEALAAQTEGRDRSKIEEAADWLRAALADGPRTTAELERLAKADGLAFRTVERGAKVAGVTRVRAGFGVPAHWTLSTPLPPTDRHSRQLSDVAGMADLGGNGERGGQQSESGTLPLVAPTGGESRADLDGFDNAEDSTDAVSF